MESKEMRFSSTYLACEFKQLLFIGKLMEKNSFRASIFMLVFIVFFALSVSPSARPSSPDFKRKETDHKISTDTKRKEKSGWRKKKKNCAAKIHIRWIVHCELRLREKK